MRAYNWVYFLFTGRWAYSWGVAGGGGVLAKNLIFEGAYYWGLIIMNQKEAYIQGAYNQMY